MGHPSVVPRSGTCLFRCNFVVVLLAIDLAAGAILFAIDLAMLLRRQLSPVGCAIGANLLIDSLLAILGARGFAGSHGAILDAVGDAVLLIFATLADFVVAVVRLRGVVLVVVDGPAEVVLLAVDPAALLRG